MAASVDRRLVPIDRGRHREIQPLGCENLRGTPNPYLSDRNFEVFVAKRLLALTLTPNPNRPPAIGGFFYHILIFFIIFQKYDKLHFLSYFI